MFWKGGCTGGLICLMKVMLLVWNIVGALNTVNMILCITNVFLVISRMQQLRVWKWKGHIRRASRKSIVCDRNFGLYSQKKKAVERIETQQEYIKIIESARDPAFIIVQEHQYELNDNEASFKGAIKNLHISKGFYIKFNSDGNVNVCENYYDQPRSFKITPFVLFDNIKNQPPPIVGMADEKIRDVESLLRYMRLESRDYFVEHFKKVGKKATKKEVTEKSLEGKTKIKIEKKKAKKKKEN